MRGSAVRQLRAWMSRVAALVHVGGRDRDLADELESHVQLHVDDNVRAGMSPDEARRVALVALGGVEAVKEQYRRRRGLPWLESVGQDMRYGVRSLLRTPGFTLAAMLVLALGVGANTAIFSVVQATLLRPLPIRQDGRVAVVWVDNLALGRSRGGPTGQDYLDWKEAANPFEDLFLFEHGSGTITGHGEPEQVKGLRVTTNFAEFLGVTPVLGRAFIPPDSTRNALLLSQAYWQRRFNADPGIVGQTVTLNSEPYTVIGVLPTDACFWYPADVVVPWPLDRLRQVDSNLGVFGRLKPSGTFAAAQAEMDAIALRIAAARPEERKGWGISVVPLRDVTVQYIRPALLVLLGAVGCVLLIACANVANLLVARTLARQKEIAVRAALGAGRGRLVQQFLVESLLIGLAGGLLGLVSAAWGDTALRQLIPASIPVPAAASQVPLPQGHIDASVLAFTLALSLGVGLVFGLGPMLTCLRHQPAEKLKDGARTIGAGTATSRSRGALVIIETTLAIVLVVGSGLMIKTFWNLLTVRPGFTPENLITMQIKFSDDAPDSPYRQAAGRAVAVGRMLEEVRAVPAVQSAALAMILPMSQDDQDRGEFVVAEQGSPTSADQRTSEFRIVTSGYFATMGIPVRAGRAFTDADTAASQGVVVIDETLARTYFGSADAIGRHLQFGSRPPREIVGVVGGVRDDGLDREARPTIYIPYPQAPAQTMSLVIRTRADAETMVSAVKHAIWRIDPNQPLFSVRSMGEIVANTISATRVAFVLLAVFAAIAVTLAAVGIYSVTSYGARQRTREVGVRMALGASRTDVLWLVIGSGMRYALAGTTVGLVAATGLAHALSSLLFGVAPLDSETFVAVGVGFAVVALVANGIPAWRAATLDPAQALSDR
jgi:putative ABC transport system permease protein